MSRHGGAGNRTPVRTSIPNCIYVRRLRFKFSRGWHAAILPPEKLSKKFTLGTRAGPAVSLTLRYPRTASGGLPRGQVRSKLLTQPEPIQSWQLLVFPVFLPGSEYLDTQQNLHKARRSQSPPGHKRNLLVQSVARQGSGITQIQEVTFLLDRGRLPWPGTSLHRLRPTSYPHGTPIPVSKPLQSST